MAKVWQVIKSTLIFLFDCISLRKVFKNKFLLWGARFILWTALYVGAMETNFLWLCGYTPTLEEIRHPDVAIASELISTDSVIIGKYYYENRTPITYDKISPLLVDALVATEDVRFYKHHGLDIYALISSMVSTAQGDQRGGSTITQQLVKNMFKTRKETNQGLLQYIPIVKTVIYKSKEWITATKLELFYSKQDILEMYFNTVDFGNNWFGVKVASQNYFSKQPLELKLEEAALLVGMLKATSSYNPIRNKKRSTERRNVVLGQMLKYDYIKQNTFDSVSALPIKLTLKQKKRSDEHDSYIRVQAENILKKWCEKYGYNLYEDGLKIYCTIDSRLQKFAEDATRDHMSKLQSQFYKQWGKQNPWRNENGGEIANFIEDNIKNTPVYADLVRQYGEKSDSVWKMLRAPKQMKVFTWSGAKDTTFSSYDSLRYYAKILRSGMMSLDPYTGYIKAYVGGIDHKFFKFDQVFQGKRQPGSTFKPFAYLAAMDCGFSPCSRMTDKPIKIRYEGGQEWEPHNANEKFSYRNMTLRRALGRSCNAITAQLTDSIGWGEVIEYAHKCGIRSKLDSVPSICLGCSDVSLFELVNAYGTILNQGIRVDPMLIVKITDKNGKMLAEFKPQFEQMVNPESAWLTLFMLMGSIQEPGGTAQSMWGYKVFDDGNEIASKTGTTSNESDGWFVGITKNLVTGAWVGADYRSVHLRYGLGQGAHSALPIVGKYLEKALHSKGTGVRTGKLSKPPVKIRKEYWCQQQDDIYLRDSIRSDSTIIAPSDSNLIFEIEVPKELLNDSVR
ncbi:MAG TPA: transglycosylase domain-containing protein [Bacteroidia bacterium]|nr:transglycosylase domain-containing protein [Bacteroidia bacterium]